MVEYMGSGKVWLKLYNVNIEVKYEQAFQIVKKCKK